MDDKMSTNKEEEKAIRLWDQLLLEAGDHPPQAYFDLIDEL